MEINVKILKEMYIDKNMKMEEVGDYFGVSKIKIKNILKKANIRKNKKNILVNTKCSSCGEPIIRNKRDYDKSTNHFCSDKCKYNFKKVKVICDYCGKENHISKSKVTVNNFCNEDCYKKWKKENSFNKCCICGEEGYTVEKFKGKYYCKKHYNHMYRHGKILEYTIHDKNEIIKHDDFLEIITKDVKGVITGST
ncbi:hypothetical protein QUF55_09225, partial [Clostridiaceae bacterium HSG29]|nr:hypothetical protein [Clostridiaceae bacterium HSG29]